MTLIQCKTSKAVINVGKSSKETLPVLCNPIFRLSYRKHFKLITSCPEIWTKASPQGQSISNWCFSFQSHMPKVLQLCFVQTIQLLMKPERSRRTLILSKFLWSGQKKGKPKKHHEQNQSFHLYFFHYIFNFFFYIQHNNLVFMYCSFNIPYICKYVTRS